MSIIPRSGLAVQFERGPAHLARVFRGGEARATLTLYHYSGPGGVGPLLEPAPSAKMS